MKKLSKASKTLRSGTRNKSNSSELPPELSAKEKLMIERRQKNPGLEICKICLGIVWNLGTHKRCGDCGC